ncbi:hypothetical protein [Longispora albida]|uniref:hypothetical protein n=1 Tax=Longispora albida TaxID=203523 RepID=UPI0012F95986|nr:hypothetical protein [Longispora albida]
MSVPLREFIPKLKRHHGIYVPTRTYDGTCSFLVGYDLASGKPVLKEFHTWLLLRGKGRPELYWPWLVLCEIHDDGALPNVKHMTAEQDEEAVSLLFLLIEEFFESRDSSKTDK